MSAQYHSAQPVIGADGVKTYINRDGDTVQESSGPVPIFRGLAAAGGEAFVSDSEESEEDYHQHTAHYIPQHGHPVSEKKSKKEKKDKKSKKSKKERSGSSSSSNGCNCGHSH